MKACWPNTQCICMNNTRMLAKQKRPKRTSSPQHREKQRSEIDMNDLIEKVSQFDQNDYIYLTYAVPQSSEKFTPYSLKEVDYEDVDKTLYFTMSRSGVTSWSRHDKHFTNLSTWRNEYNQYCRISAVFTYYITRFCILLVLIKQSVFFFLFQLKSFRKYRLWKGFKVWQKTIQWRKMKKAKQHLEMNLFILQPDLIRCIFFMRQQYCRFVEIDFLDVECANGLSPNDFVQTQADRFQKIQLQLKQFRVEMCSMLCKRFNAYYI